MKNYLPLKYKLKKLRKNPEFPIQSYVRVIKDFRLYKGLNGLDKLILLNSFQKSHRFKFHTENYTVEEKKLNLKMIVLYFKLRFDKFRYILGIIFVYPNNKIEYFDFLEFKWQIDNVTNVETTIDDIIESLKVFYTNKLTIDVENYIKTLKPSEKEQISTTLFKEFQKIDKYAKT